MDRNEFYEELYYLPQTYRFDVNNNKIVGLHRVSPVNPVTAVAYRKTGVLYGNNKRETLKAGRALGLSSDFTSQIYEATKGAYNRGNTQVIRGRIRSALGV